jgi:hypothetical protein
MCERHRDGSSCSNSFHLVEKHYSVSRVRSANRIDGPIDSFDNLGHSIYGRAGRKKGTPLAMWTVFLVSLPSRPLAGVPFMATKSTITPHDTLLNAHLHRGVVAERPRMIDSLVTRPIRTVCAWCAGQDRPTAVLVDVPIDDRGLSHGICPSCMSKLRSRRRASASANWR